MTKLFFYYDLAGRRYVAPFVNGKDFLEREFRDRVRRFYMYSPPYPVIKTPKQHIKRYSWK